MKRLYSLIAVALLLFGVAASAGVWDIPSGTAEAGVIISPVSGGGGEPVTKYVGYQNTDGTPDSPTGAYETYGSDPDRTYGRLWQATENGTAVAIYLRWGVSDYEDPYPGDGYSWITLYSGTTLIGTANPAGTQVQDTWVRYELTVADGQSLNFSSTDNLYFGISYDDGEGNWLGGIISVDSGGPTDVTYFDNTNSVATAPNTTVTWSGPSSTGGLAVMLEYTTAE